MVVKCFWNCCVLLRSIECTVSDLAHTRDVYLTPYTRFRRRDLTGQMMTTSWLIPVVAPIVAAATGSIIAAEMLLTTIDPQSILITIVVSFALACSGGIMTFMMITLYFYQLLFSGLPEGIKICTFFLPMGPVSQIGCCALLMNQVVQPTLSLHESSVIPGVDGVHVINILGILIAFALWSMATTWMVLAMFALIEAVRKANITFSPTFWCMLYPLVNIFHFYYQMLILMVLHCRAYTPP